MAGLPPTTGNIFFVDSGAAGAADNTERGKTTEQPFATIDYAVGQCTANNGDQILVMPGHAETVSAAGGLDMDVAGVTVIGLGDGPDQPTVTLDTADTADIDIDAAGITFINIHFVANFLDIATCFDVNADDFSIKGCRFTDTSTILNFLVVVQDAAATASDRITIENCRAIQKGAANTHFVNFAGTGDGHIVRGNHLMGNWETMCIGGAGIVTYCTITDNVIFNEVADADHCINMAATATGICARNMVTGGHATAGIVPGDLGALENYYEGNTTDLSGSIEPAIV
jgi:hypothetical protein